MSWINLTALWKIVVFGLLAGVGIPALFSLGLLAMSQGPKARAAGTDGDVVVGGSAVGLVTAAVCFVIVVAALAWCIYEIYKIGHPAAAK